MIRLNTVLALSALVLSLVAMAMSFVPNADVNRDGRVDVVDVQLVVNAVLAGK